MKTLIPIILAVLGVACTGPPLQYAESSPEIELAKKANAAYVSGDWDALRALYADTARIAVNTWTPDKWITVDQLIEAFKADRETFPKVKLSDDAVYSMIVNSSGEKWVLNWVNWTAKSVDGKEVSTPVHLAFRMSGEKFGFVVIMLNDLPAYLALQPAPTAEAAQP